MHVYNRVVALYRGGVNHMNKRLCPLNMAKELNPKTHALAGALHNTRNIGKNKVVAVIHLHHAEIWRKRCKVVVGNLWVSVSNH